MKYPINGFIIGPKVITNEVKKMWFDNYDRPFICEICGNPLKINGSFARTFSNFGTHNGGNPITGDCCFDIPYKKRLEIWDLQLKIDVVKIAYERVMGDVSNISTNEKEINKLVDKFLAWEIPYDFCSDPCVTDSNYPFPRYGTHIMTADEAKKMFKYLLLKETE